MMADRNGPKAASQVLLRIALYLALVLIAVLINWPGRANPDTVDMLHQATNLQALNEWHTPVITFCYGLLGPLFGYPGGALVLQVALLMTWPSQLLADALMFRGSRILWVPALVGAGLVVVVLLVLSGQVVKDVLSLSLMSVVFFIIMPKPLTGFSTLSRPVTCGLILISMIYVTIRPTSMLILLFAATVLAVSRTAWRPAPLAKAVAAIVVISVVSFGALTGARWLLPAKDDRPPTSGPG